MKRRNRSFSGSRPVFTGAVSIVPGGFNLDKENQSFAADATIPEGSLAVVDEIHRTVRIVKTAKVVAIDADDSKKISLKVTEFYEPLFVEGESILKAGAISGLLSNAPTISKVIRTDNSFDIVLSAAIDGLAVGDVIEQVVAASNKEVVAGIVVSHGQSDHIYMVTPGLDIAAGDKVMNYPLAEGALIANAIAVTSYDKVSGKLVLASDPTNAAAGDSIVKVYASGTAAVTTQEVASEIGLATRVVVSDTPIREDETPIDISADTMQYSLFERRVPAIPESQKSGEHLAGNAQIRLTQAQC